MMRNAKQGASLVFALFFAFAFLVPQISLAQEVPVKDAVVRTKIGDLLTQFGAYSKNFDKYAANFDTQLKDVRDIITGGNPPGPAKTACHQGRTPQPAKAYVPTNDNPDDAGYDAQNWWRASEETNPNSDIPKEITTPSNGATGYVKMDGYVAVNDSGSLRCLLQELVEWQKLELSIQLHSMLKTYISDAQTKQLSGKLMNKISAAKLNWGKAGNTVINNGVITSEAVYNTNASQSIYNVKSRQLDHFTAQAVADPDAPSDVGSLASCKSWQLDTAANVVEENRLSTEDLFASTRSRTECPLPNNGNDFAEFSEDFNSPKGGMNMFLTVISNPAASPLGSASQLNTEARIRITNQEQAKRDEFANTGARAVVECSGTPEDPYCLDEQYGTAVTPAYQTERAVGDAASQGDRQVESGDALDAVGENEASSQSTNLNTAEGGLLGFDETGMSDSPTAVDELVREFYDVIEIGYFGIQENTIDWAQGTMLMIYDEMKFDRKSPGVVVTTGPAEDPIEEYNGVW